MGIAVAAVAVLAAIIVVAMLMRGGDKPSKKSTKSAKAGKNSTQRRGNRTTTPPRRNNTTTRQNQSITKTPYAAVTAQPGMNACAAVQEIVGKRYLEAEAPKLPLPECDKANCHCKFSHHDDRRSDEGQDRRVGFGLQSELYGTGGEQNRRKKRGRRITDV